MFDLQQQLRPNVRELVPYSSAREECTLENVTLLDANENPFGSPVPGQLHRYPDPLQRELKEAIAAYRGVRPEQVFVGHGSDEALDLLIRAVCAPGKDEIVMEAPSYGMYSVSAKINDVAVRKVQLDEEFRVDAKTVIARSEGAKIVFLCSPNNPTANALPKQTVVDIATAVNCLVVVDEAYIDFAGEGASVVGELAAFRNLVVLQTLSKAWGLAGIRVGFAFASPELVAVLTRLKPPYNVGTPAQRIALQALREPWRMESAVKEIRAQRKLLVEELGSCTEVVHVYPSDANFLLVRMKNARRAYEFLLKKQIVVRDRSKEPGCAECLRITVGTPAENKALINALRELGGEQSQPLPAAKTGSAERVTSETSIAVQLKLEGSGKADIQTGIGFFDHMLEQLARHGGMDVSIKVKGDLHVDEHHTIEDTGIALGQALDRALGERRGIARYGFVLPMDESLALVAIDLSGRSWLEWKVDFKREKIGAMPTEMFKHFFHSFSNAGRFTLHIEARGENEHHKIEAIFKGVARALAEAVSSRGRADAIPSSKGSL